MSASINQGKPVTAGGAAPDLIQYREYKLLLKADHFLKPAQFHKFWKITRRIAKKLGVVIRKRGKPMETHLREVIFFDTPHFRLYNNGFILRRRTFYKKGLPQLNHEVTLKFRQADKDLAASIDVHPTLPSASTIKFKEEVLLPRDKPVGIRIIYSHGCEIDTPSTIISQSFESAAQIFPALQRTGAKAKTALSMVNNVAVEEVLVNLGEIDFGGRMTAKATLAIWRNRMTQAHLVGEYSYQIKFATPDAFHGKPRELSEAFYLELQKEAADWIQFGTTKTALIYGLGKEPIQNHE
jgi:hypothetical protein